MSDDLRRAKELGPADQQVARTKDNSIGVDDIGLPSGMPANEVSKLNEIKPDPTKIENKS